jgi:hypothetical protein
MSLKIRLKEWTDWDGAMFCLAKSLGMMDETVNFAVEAKHVFWSANPVGDFLGKTLDELVEIGFLEKRDEPDFQYRYNSAFTGSWE